MSIKYRDKITLVVVCLAVFAILNAALVWHASWRSQTHLTQVILAEANLATYLAVAANVNDLAKQYADALVIGDRDNGEGERVLKARLADDISRLKETTRAEVEEYGAEEVAEVERIIIVERLIAGIDREFGRLKVLPTDGSNTDVYARLVTLFDERIDHQLKGLIRGAVQEEEGEVTAIREEATRIQALTRHGAELTAVLAVAVAVGALVVLRRALHQPLTALLDGVRAIGAGQLSHRITVAGGDELGQLSASFNRMAEQLEAALQATARQKSALEAEVGRRTHELSLANERLSDQDQRRRRFLADVSHELRTPLTVMRGEADIALRMRDGSLGEDARQSLEAIIAQVDHMGSLVDDLLFVARRESGEARLALRPVALQALLETVIASARGLAEPVGVRISFEPRIERPVVDADPGRLRQLLMVLIDNAVRYGARGGDVRVTCHSAPQGVLVTVEDDGIGIPEDEIERVFERFVRGSNALPGGSGLGLPVAKAIAEAHGGTLRIASREGEGTTATVTLPLSDPIRSVA